MIARSRDCPLLAASAGALLLCAVQAPATAAPHTYTVVIDKLKFGPLPAQLHKGDAIIWVNKDMFRHTATAADHSFDVDLMPGKAGKTMLTKSGSIPFICRYHPNMRGVLVVK
jgi:plastocyanin